MSVSELDTYINTIDVVKNNINYVEGAVDVIEDRIIHDDKFPVVRDGKVKTCCKYTLELTKLIINCMRVNVDIYNHKKKP